MYLSFEEKTNHTFIILGPKMGGVDFIYLLWGCIEFVRAWVANLFSNTAKLCLFCFPPPLIILC